MKTRRILAMVAALCMVLLLSVRAEEGALVEVPIGTVIEEQVSGTEGSEQKSPWLDDTMAQVETWTAWLMEQIYTYRNDIISALGALAFVVYSFLYKKKLVPSVDKLKTDVTSTMANVIENVQNYIENFSGKLNTQQEVWTKDINAIAEIVKKYEAVMQETQKQQTQVLALEQQLAASDMRNQIYGQIMRTQVEMMHQTLSSACLSDEQHAANHKVYLKALDTLEALDAELAASTSAVVEVIEQTGGDQT